MSKSITFSRAGDAWLRRLPNEVREDGHTVSANTVRIYTQAFKRADKILGDLRLDVINNETIRDYIAAMRSEGYSPATICGDLIVVKLVVESITRNGVPVFPLAINRKFVRRPRIVPDEQNAPCATREEIERALTHPELAGPIAVASGIGLRISEALSLHLGDCPGLDSWDAENAVVHIRATLKTSSARRSIPVPAELNSFLQHILADKAHGDPLFTLSRNRLYNLLDSRDLPAMHSYRRFFATIRDEAGINTNALKRLLGHSKGADITARYSKAAEKLDFLRVEMSRIPLGFSLPAVAAPQSVKPREAMAMSA